MSLFITDLAYDNETYLVQAKMGILSASIIAGLIGYFYLRILGNKIETKTETADEED